MSTAAIDARGDTRPVGAGVPDNVVAWLQTAWPVRVGLSALAAVAAYYSTLLNPRSTPFQDEGLYLYMGHRVISNWTQGTALTEFPGAYFSGAPGVYPPLAAVADNIGGLAAARALSLVFVLAAGLCVYAITRELFGRLAGLLANAAFLANGSVLFQAHLATFDAMMMFLLALGCYLAVRGARHDNLLYGLVIAAVLTLAFMTKYTAVAFIPIIVALCVAVGWQRSRWLIVNRTCYLLIATVALTYFWIQLFARDIIPGMKSTTLDRTALGSESAASMSTSLLLWTGPWLIAACLGFIGSKRSELPLRVVMLAGAVVVPLGQIHAHEPTSFAKHMAFGMVFAAPLIGELLARVLRSTRLRGTPTVAATLALFCVIGITYERQFATGWIDDRPLRAPLVAAIAANPSKVVLAEEGSAQRYELRKQIRPRQWADTFAFSYGGKTGMPAYETAIRQSHFGVIYLSITTAYGRQIHSYLISHSTPYILGSKAPRYLRGTLVGNWLIFVPRTTA